MLRPKTGNIPNRAKYKILNKAFRIRSGCCVFYQLLRRSTKSQSQIFSLLPSRKHRVAHSTGPKVLFSKDERKNLLEKLARRGKEPRNCRFCDKRNSPFGLVF